MLRTGDLVEILTKLLRDSYMSYPQLCERYGALSAEALWKELEEERVHWRMQGTLLRESDYLCMTPYVLRRRCTLLAMLNQLQLAYPQKNGVSLPTLKQELWTRAIALETHRLLWQQLQDVKGDPLLILFCLSLLPQDACSLCQLWKEWVIPLAPLADQAFFYEQKHLDELLAKADKTYLFLQFLSQLELNFEECLLLLKRDCGDHLRMSCEQLQHRYPLLSHRQIAFFVAHRGRGEYYSIQEYMRCMNVCYETARQAMEQLVAQRWYRRRKIGKRFYYTTVVGQSDGVF